jgi:hypothetical protein
MRDFLEHHEWDMRAVRDAIERDRMIFYQHLAQVRELIRRHHEPITPHVQRIQRGGAFRR